MDASAINALFYTPGADVQATDDVQALFRAGDHTSALRLCADKSASLEAGQSPAAVYCAQDKTLSSMFAILDDQDGKMASNFGVCTLFLDALGACLREMGTEDAVNVVRRLSSSHKKLIMHPLSASDAVVALSAMKFINVVVHTQPTSVLREFFANLQLIDSRSFTTIPARAFSNKQGSQKRKHSARDAGASGGQDSRERQRDNWRECRRLYIDTMLTCLMRDDAEFTGTLFYAPLSLWHDVFRFLPADAPEDIQRMLNVLYQHVLTAPDVRIVTKKQLFSYKTLQGFVAMYESASEQIVQIVHAYFVSAIDQYDIVFSAENDRQHATSNVLFTLILQLKANEDVTQQKLVLSVLKRHPSLLCQYIKQFPYSCDPRLSHRWLGNMALLQKLLRLLARDPLSDRSPTASSSSPRDPSSSATQTASARDEGKDSSASSLWSSTSNAQLSRMVTRLLPKKLTVANLKSGLMHKNGMIRHITLGLLQSIFVCYESVVSALHPVAIDSLSVLSAALRTILPDVKVVYVLWTTMKPVAHDAKSQLILARILTVLNLYQRNIPQSFTEAKFDMHKRVELLLHSQAHNEYVCAAYMELLRGHRGLSPLLWTAVKLSEGVKNAVSFSHLLPSTGIGCVLYALVTCESRKSVLYARAHEYLELILTRVHGLWLDAAGSELRSHYRTMQIRVWLSQLSRATVQPMEAVLCQLIKQHHQGILKAQPDADTNGNGDAAHHAGGEGGESKRLPLLAGALALLSRAGHQSAVVDSHWHTYVHLVMHQLLMLFAGLPSPRLLRAFAEQVVAFNVSASAEKSMVYRQFITSPAFSCTFAVCQRVVQSEGAKFAHFGKQQGAWKNQAPEIVDDVIERLGGMFELHKQKREEGNRGETEPLGYMGEFSELIAQLWTHVARLVPAQLNALLPPLIMFCRNLTPTHWRRLICDGVFSVLHEFSLFDLEIVKNSTDAGGDVRDLIGNGLSVQLLLYHASAQHGDCARVAQGDDSRTAVELFAEVVQAHVFVGVQPAGAFERFTGLHMLCHALCSLLQHHVLQHKTVKAVDVQRVVCLLDLVVHGVRQSAKEWMPAHLVQTALLQPNGGLMAVLPGLAQSPVLFSYVPLLMNYLQASVNDSETAHTRNLASIALDAYAQLVTESCVASRDDCLTLGGQLPFAFTFIPLCRDLLSVDQCTALTRRLLPFQVPAESRLVVNWWLQCLLQSHALLEVLLAHGNAEAIRVLPVLISEGAKQGMDTQHADRLLYRLSAGNFDVRTAANNNLVGPAFFTFCLESLMRANETPVDSAVASVDRSLLFRSLFVASVVRRNNPLHVRLFGQAFRDHDWSYSRRTACRVLLPALQAYASCVGVFALNSGAYDENGGFVRARAIAMLESEDFLQTLLLEDVSESENAQDSDGHDERMSVATAARALLLMHAASLSTTQNQGGDEDAEGGASVSISIHTLMSRITALASSAAKSSKRVGYVSGLTNSVAMNLLLLGGAGLRAADAPEYALQCIDTLVHECADGDPATREALMESVVSLCTDMPAAAVAASVQEKTGPQKLAKLLKKLSKLYLKHHLASDWHMRVLSAALECFAPVMDASVFAVDTVLEMLMSHSLFVSLVLNTATEGDAQDGLGLLQLLKTLITLNPSQLKALDHKKVVYLLLAAFQGTTSAKDAAVWQVLTSFQFDALAFPPVVGSHKYKFGKAGRVAMERITLDEKSDVKKSVSITNDAGWVYRAFDSAILRRGPLLSSSSVATAAATDLKGGGSQGQIEMTTSSSSSPSRGGVVCYEHSFLFPFLENFLTQNKVDIRKLIRMGMVTFVLKGMCHPDSAIRQHAYACVGAFFGALESYKDAGLGFAEFPQVHLVMNALKNGISSQHQRMPALICEFVSFSLTVMLQPGHNLYKVLNKFYIARPAIDVTDVPMFYQLFHSASANDYKQHRSWFLRMIGDCAYLTDLDLTALSRRFTVQVLLGYYDSDISDFFTRKLILNILGQCVAADVRSVLREYDLLAWIRMKLLCDMEVMHVSGWTHLLRLVQSICKQLDAQPESDSAAPASLYAARQLEDELVMLLFELCASFSVVYEQVAARREGESGKKSDRKSTTTTRDMVVLYVSVVHRIATRVGHRVRIPHCQKVRLVNDTSGNTVDASAYLTPEWFVSILMMLHDYEESGSALARVSPMLVSIVGCVWPRVPAASSQTARVDEGEHLKALLIWFLTALTDGTVEPNCFHVRYLFRLLTAVHASGHFIRDARDAEEQLLGLHVLSHDEGFSRHLLRSMLKLSWFSHHSDPLYAFYLNSAVFTYVVGTTDHGDEVRHATGSALLDKMHRLTLHLLPNPLLSAEQVEHACYEHKDAQFTAFVRDTRTLLYQHHIVQATHGEKAAQQALQQLRAFMEDRQGSSDAIRTFAAQTREILP